MKQYRKEKRGQKQYTPDIAVAYIATYKDRETRTNKKYLRLFIKLDELRKVVTDEAEEILLIGFPNRFKREENHPDFRFRLNKPRKNVSPKEEELVDEGLPF